MKIPPNTLKIGAGVVVIVGAILALASINTGKEMSYYVKIG